MIAAAPCRQSATLARQPGIAPASMFGAHSLPHGLALAERDQTATLADPSASLLQHDFGEVKIHARTPRRVQAKLKIGAPDDASEREADAVADQIMRSPATAEDVATPCPGCAANARDGETLRRQPVSPFSIDDGLVEEDEGVPGADAVQAKSIAGARPSASPGVASHVKALRAGGDPLPGAVKRFMEPRFGHDFGKVRIHTGKLADKAASGVNARAFTIGRDVVFGRGQFAPGSEEGKRLIAHELTHVVQQGHAASYTPGMTTKADAGVARRSPAAEAVVRGTEDGVIRRVAWTPNKPTGKVSHPWGSSGPAGKISTAATDAGTPLDIWRPNNGKTYWCHGYTFGGSTARGGPYSIWGNDVPTVLKDDGWQQTYSCMAQPADVLVFWDDKGKLTHSGIIRRVSAPGGRVDDTASTLESKWGPGPHNTTTWATNAKGYGKYRCYSKAPFTGVCSGKGANEI